MTKHTSDKRVSDTASSLAALAEDIISLMIREHLKIQQELGSISQLVDDASRSLSSSFQQISAGLDQHTTNQDPGAETPATTTAVETQEYINVHYKKVVSALQFDDIVQQISRHSQSRTQHIQLMFEQLSARLNEMKAADFEYSPAFETKIQQLRQDVQQLGAELDKESPARQARLVEGKSELF